MRHLGREIALQILFQQEFTHKVDMSDFLNLFDDSVPKEAMSYAEEILLGIKNKTSEIDTLIKSTSKNWKLERMSIVDRNILRIAVFELKFANNKLSANIIINEAIEISKKFSSHDSSSFINGLLDSIAKGK